LGSFPQNHPTGPLPAAAERARACGPDHRGAFRFFTMSNSPTTLPRCPSAERLPRSARLVWPIH